jgi:hypothetical protein
MKERNRIYNKNNLELYWNPISMERIDQVHNFFHGENFDAPLIEYATQKETIALLLN